MNINKKERGILNSLKMGVIPKEKLLDFMVGKDYYLDEIDRCISLTKENLSVAKMVLGSYGTGKSFFMNVVKEIGLKENMVVASIQINKTFKLNSFADIYYQIMHSVMVSNEEKTKSGFESIFDIWINKLKEKTSEEASKEINNVISNLNDYNSSYARAFLSYIKARIHNDYELAFAASSWIKGEKNIPTSLKAKFEVKGDIDKSNSINMLKAFFRLIKLIGYRGIIILVDELDVLLNVRSDLREASFENIRYIIDSLGSGSFENSMFLFSATENLLEDPDRGIVTYLPLFQRLGSCIDKKGSSLLDKRQVILRLKNINEEDLDELTNKIVSLHKVSYNWTPKISNNSIKCWTLVTLKKENKKIFPVNIREFIIKIIEMLDVMEQNPNNTIFTKELDIKVKNGNQIFVNSPSVSNKN